MNAKSRRMALESMSKALCQSLMKEGKPVISKWQLNFLLSLYDDPEQAVNHAHTLVDELTPAEPTEMTTKELLKRLNMPQHL